MDTFHGLRYLWVTGLGLIYLIFAWMNAYAVNKGRSPVQTVLIRVAMSWGLAVSVLGEFSLSQLPVADDRAPSPWQAVLILACVGAPAQHGDCARRAARAIACPAAF